jgi:MATE family multidrug resistance protein
VSVFGNDPLLGRCVCMGGGVIITSYVGHLGAAELSALVLAQTVFNVTGNAP